MSGFLKADGYDFEENDNWPQGFAVLADPIDVSLE